MFYLRINHKIEFIYMVENNFDSDIMNAKAYLEVIAGPMFSGKTSMLLQIYKNYKFSF